MREQRCIICGQKRNGLEVRDDNVIRSLRWFKKNVMRSERGYNLIVCRECFEKHKKMRDKYNKRRITYTGIGIVFMVFMLLTAGSRILAALFYGALVVAFMYALSLLSYMPELRMPAHPQRKRPKLGTSANRNANAHTKRR